MVDRRFIVLFQRWAHRWGGGPVKDMQIILDAPSLWQVSPLGPKRCLDVPLVRTKRRTMPRISIADL
jgi:hypothetical protein